MYRILQECLTNILKHAAASRVSIGLKKTTTDYHFMITDNGIGFMSDQPLTKSSIGIIIMKDRVASLDGSIELKSRKNKGTSISIHLPLTIENL